jgi:hypothetical protein
MDMSWLALMIPLAPFMLGGLVIWTRHQSKMMDKQSSISAEKAAQYAVRNEHLEERVRVLERIVTDKGFDLASQIEDLRDRPIN